MDPATQRLIQSLRFDHLATLGASRFLLAHSRQIKFEFRPLFARLASCESSGERELREILWKNAWRRSLRRLFWSPGMYLWGAATRVCTARFRLLMALHLFRKSCLLHRACAERAREAGRDDIARRLEAMQLSREGMAADIEEAVATIGAGRGAA